MKVEDHNALNDLSTFCTDLLSSSKSTYYTNLEKKLNNPLTGPKAYWSILNRFLDKKNIPTIPPIIVGGKF